MNIPEIPFQPFPKIPRLSREVVVTEKIDGTNAQVYIDGSGQVFAGSRNRWITPEKDNYGFARWVEQNVNELRKLGPGHHYGEWWGCGVQRNYDLSERRFSLFNVSRWIPVNPMDVAVRGAVEANNSGNVIACCHVVPTIWRGDFDTQDVERFVEMLRLEGSFAAPGFRNPEGVVIYHTAAGEYFKKTCVDDEKPKGLQHPVRSTDAGREAAQEAFNHTIVS